jgi:glycosyltransferase involved in cell wall biosynthesis
MPKISVITPIYRTEKYLDRCLQSLVSQTLDDIELIWIDNGASDECRAIIAKYQKKRPNIQVVHLTENVGYGGAMNKGLDIATGEYIGFCDSDDYVDSDFFEKMYLKASETKSDIVYGEYKEESENKTVRSAHRLDADICYSLKDKIRAIKNGAVWDKIYKFSYLRESDLRFVEKIPFFFEDNLFSVLAVVKAPRICLLHDGFYHYVQNPSSSMHFKTFKQQRQSSALETIADLLNYAVRQGFELSVKECLFDFICRSLPIKQLLRNHDTYLKLVNLLQPDDFFLLKLAALHKQEHPNVFQRIFYVRRDEKQVSVRLFGFKITHHKPRKGNN